MNWENVHRFVEAWVAERGLPKDLSRSRMEMVRFNTEEDCRFFYPDRDLLSHEAFLNSLARWVRERKGGTRRVTITPDHYHAWLAADKAQDSAETRSRFIESRCRLFPLEK